jgi:hypothetical protein
MKLNKRIIRNDKGTVLQFIGEKQLFVGKIMVVWLKNILFAERQFI